MAETRVLSELLGFLPLSISKKEDLHLLHHLIWGEEGGKSPHRR